MSASRRAAAPTWIVGVTLLLPSTLAVMGTAVLSPVLPSMLEYFRASPHSDYLTPLVLTTPSVCIALFSTLAGAAADRYGRRRLLLYALAIYAVVGMAPIVLNGLTAILATRVALGLTEATVLTVSTTMIVDYFQEAEREKWLAYQIALAAVSAVFLTLLGGALGAFGWRGPFFSYAASALMLALVLIFTRPEPPRAPTARARLATRITAVPASSFPWRRIGGICAMAAFASVLFFAVPIELGVALHAVGLTNPALLGGMVALATLGIAAGTLAFRHMARVPAPAILLVAFGLSGLGFFGIACAGQYRLMTGAAFVSEVGCGIVLPALITWAARNLPFEFRGRGMGFYQSSFAMGQFFSPVILTAASHRMGGIVPAFAVFGGAALAAAVIAPLAGAIATALAARAAARQLPRP